MWTGPHAYMSTEKMWRCRSTNYDQIINMSLESGTVPADLNIAHLSPLLKKTSLDVECFENYTDQSQTYLSFQAS